MPLPAPGYSTPFGILIFLLAIQLILGAKMPWLPEKIMQTSVKLETVQKVIQAALPALERIERLSQPRIAYICTSLPGRIILGIAIAVMALSMIIPLPGTNTLPAMGIFITAFGLQEDDGFISLIGLLFCLIAGFLSSSIIWATIWGSLNLLDFMKSQLS